MKWEWTKAIGPGLLFASTAIGVTHFMLCTTAGAYFGWNFMWLILAALILKYPFFEFSSRYAAMTGQTMLQGYRKVHPVAFYGYMILQLSSMFTVTAAVAGVCGGLLDTVLNIEQLNAKFWSGLLLMLSFITLAIGRYKLLELLIKYITAVLLCTVFITFIISLWNGPLELSESFEPRSISSTASMLLVIGILGWMPNGLESSIYNSLWVVENNRADAIRHTWKNILIDYKIGYLIATVLAILFVGIGTLTFYGNPTDIVGSPVGFARSLIDIFASQLGDWSFVLIGGMAFAAIYGTLIAAWDIFARTWLHGIQLIKFKDINESAEQASHRVFWYPWVLAGIGVCGFILLQYFEGSISELLHLATLVSFLVAPIIAVLNTVVILKLDKDNRPSIPLLVLAVMGIIGLLSFTVIYVLN